MAIHDDETIIANLRETVRLQQLENDTLRVSLHVSQAELAERRRLMDALGSTGLGHETRDDLMRGVAAIRDWNRKQKGTST